MRNKIFTFCFLTALFFGCGTESPESILRNLETARTESNAADCECFFESYGFDSASACTEARQLGDLECRVQAWLPVAEINPTPFDCERSRQEAARNCIDVHGCSGEEYQACVDAIGTCAFECGGLEDEETTLQCIELANQSTDAYEACR